MSLKQSQFDINRRTGWPG